MDYVEDFKIYYHPHSIEGGFKITLFWNVATKNLVIYVKIISMFINGCAISMLHLKRLCIFILCVFKRKYKFGVAVVGSYIYWMDHQRKTLVRANKEFGNKLTVLDSNLQPPLTIIAVFDHDNEGNKY